jgi:hypothetical protein
MNAFAAIAFASLSSRLGYQMARSPVLPAFAAIGALPEFIGVIVANSPVTRIFKLPSGAPFGCAWRPPLRGTAVCRQSLL